MQNRILKGVCLVLASTVALGAVVADQAPHDAPERLGGCFTPVTTTGVYFEVTADGPTERILRAAPPATPQRATHSMPHSQMHVTATARVRVPTPEPNIDGELASRQELARVHPPAIHTLQLRHTATGALLAPVPAPVSLAPRPTHRHASAFDLPTIGAAGESVDVVINSAIGSTGCRLRLR